MTESFDLQDTLLQREREGWRASGALDGDWYRKNCTNDALFVLPGMVLDREQCADAIAKNDVSWVDYAIEDARLVLLGSDSAVLTYRCSARREGDNAPFMALISSAYVQRDDSWLLAFHQQTPLGYVIEVSRDQSE